MAEIARKNIKVFVFEEGETRTLSSKCSETGRTSKFFFNVLANEEITTLSTFNKEKAKMLKNNSWYRIVRVRCHPVFGLEIKADAVIMDTSGNLTEVERNRIEQFSRPRTLSMADASAVQNTKRISFWPVEILF